MIVSYRKLRLFLFYLYYFIIHIRIQTRPIRCKWMPWFLSLFPSGGAPFRLNSIIFCFIIINIWRNRVVCPVEFLALWLLPLTSPCEVPHAPLSSLPCNLAVDPKAAILAGMPWELLKHAAPDCVAWGTDLFSFRHSQHSSCPVWMSQNYTCFFAGSGINIFFSVPQNFSN